MQGLVIENLTHAFDGAPVVRDAGLSARPGEVVCLLGPSGCGKTTLLRLAAGLEEVQQGEVRIDGDVAGAPGRHVPPEERPVGLVFQDFALFPHLTVLDNVAFGLAHLPAKQRRHQAMAALERAGMAAHAAAYPHMLSGGQQQRVALARALAPAPRVMLLDEPFSGLDTTMRNRLRDQALHVLKASGAATLMVTHDPEEAMFMADRIALMREGRIVQQGPPAELYFHPVNAFAATFFGEVNHYTGRVGGGTVATPLGPVAAPDLPEGATAVALIRPEAVLLRPAEDGAAVTARIMAVRLLGRTTLVHLAVNGHHAHARVPGCFDSAEGDTVAIRLDSRRCHAFAESN